MLELWHCRDSRSFRALWALEELGLPYRLRLLPFPPRVAHRAYLAENPLGTVPLLVDGGVRMTESAAIPHYLAMAHAGGRGAVLPGEADFGAYLNWLHHGEATLTFPQTIYLRYGQLEPEERRQPGVAEDYRRWFLARLRLAEAALSDGRDFLVAGRFTMADISVAYALFLACQIGLAGDLPPHAASWFGRTRARDGFRAAEAVQAAAGLEPLAPAEG